MQVFWVCGSLIDDVFDRINNIVSSMDVSDEPKLCPFVLEDTQILDSSLKIWVFSGNAPDDDVKPDSCLLNFRFLLQILCGVSDAKIKECVNSDYVQHLSFLG
ncbi:hypothetical protein HA466_0021070 [Hirschfeldia incana]|nr:hypothetical protein HA466_0021070 [Hirschfeldia incana]